MFWTHLERIAGSRNRHGRNVGRVGRNQTLRERERRDDERHVNPTTPVPGMYRVIVPSLQGGGGLLPPSVLPFVLPSCPFFVEVVARCFTLRCPFGMPLCAQLQRTTQLVQNFVLRRRSDRFRNIAETFNFHTQRAIELLYGSWVLKSDSTFRIDMVAVIFASTKNFHSFFFIFFFFFNLLVALGFYFWN